MQWRGRAWAARGDDELGADSTEIPPVDGSSETIHQPVLSPGWAPLAAGEDTRDGHAPHPGHSPLPPVNPPPPRFHTRVKSDDSVVLHSRQPSLLSSRNFHMRGHSGQSQSDQAHLSRGPQLFFSSLPCSPHASGLRNAAAGVARFGASQTTRPEDALSEDPNDPAFAHRRRISAVRDQSRIGRPLPTGESLADMPSITSPSAAPLATGRGPAPAPVPPPRWKKVLYERQPFDDNYVDERAFMQELRTNTNLRSLRLDDMIRDSLVILQHMALAVVFAVLFGSCNTESVDPWQVVALDVFLLLLYFVAYVSLRPSAFTLRNLVELAEMCALFVIVILLLAPIFRTLTKSYTDDTIWALAITLCFVHLVFADYDYMNGAGDHAFQTDASDACPTPPRSFAHDTPATLHHRVPSMVSGAASQGFSPRHVTSEPEVSAMADQDSASVPYKHNLSMNAGIISSALLASRLNDIYFTAALIVFGIIVFSLSPDMRRRIRLMSREAHSALTFALCGIAIGCLLLTRVGLAAAFAGSLIAVGFVLPWFFVRVQASQFKVQISGPWDEAAPQNSAAAAEWANSVG